MNQYSDIEILKQYIDRTREILELSSPQLTGVENGEDYRRLLLRSFTKIGELAKENNRILNKHFYPLIQSTSQLTNEDILTMRDFTSSLMDATSMENIDLPLIYMQTERMLKEANIRGDLRDIILALDSMVIASYMMFNLTYRLYDYDRTDRDGKKRPLHVDKALQVAKLKSSIAPRQPMRVLKYRNGGAGELLTRCRYFQVERLLLNTEVSREMMDFCTDSNSFHALLCTDGCGVMFGEDVLIPFFKGDCIFVPANSIALKLHGKAQLLNVSC